MSTLEAINKPVSTRYQKERINLHIDPAHRQQIDVLSAEWDCTLVETVRRLLSAALGNHMHQSSEGD